MGYLPLTGTTYHITLCILASVILVGPIYAYEDADIRELEKRLAALESEHQGKMELTHSDTVLLLGGRIRMDMVYNNPSVGGSGGSNNDDISLTPRSVNMNRPTGESGEVSMSAKESRIWVKTRKPTRYGPLLSTIEMDFYGSSGNEKASNAHAPRMRHAFLNVANLTFGQTSSTFMGSATAETLHPTVDEIAIRQPLIRWSRPFDGSVLHLAIEQPESLLVDSNGTTVVPDDDRAPDFIAKYVAHGVWGEVSLAAMARQIRADSETIAPEKADARLGTAFHFSGRLHLVSLDELRFDYAWGNGLGRYIGGGSAVYPAGRLDGEGRITLQNITGGHLAYRHGWSSAIRSVIAYGFVISDNDAKMPETTDSRSASTHLNIQWSPIRNGMLALEYIQVMRELESGNAHTLDRLQFAASYDF